MTKPAHRAGLLFAVIALAVLVPGRPAAADPGTACPETRAEYAGQHVTSVRELAKNLRCANLRGAVFDGLDLSQLNFDGADAQGASFRHADLTQADFTGADLRGAKFDGADLIQSTFTRADARRASFSDVDLSQATLRNTNLAGADLDFADLTQADLHQADLRGASLWWTGAIQARTGGLRVDPVQPGAVQLTWLTAVVALALLVRRTIRAVRARRLLPASWLVLLSALLPTLGFALAGALVMLIAGELIPLFLADAYVPLLITAALLYLRALIPRPADLGVASGDMSLKSDMSADTTPRSAGEVGG